MEIDIRKEEAHRVVTFFNAISHGFPEVASELLRVAHEAKDGITIEVTPLVFRQTNEQRGYYWKWCRAFGEFCGTTPDETHEEILCITYGTDYTETRFGLKRRPLKRSHDANRIEYSTLIDTLIRVAAELGFVVPPPIRKINQEEYENDQ